MDLRERQHELEIQYDTAAAVKRLKQLREDSLNGSVDLPRAAKLISNVYARVAEELRVHAETPTRGIGGKYKKWLRALQLDVAAVIAVRECIRLCTCVEHERGVQVQDLTINIGKLWETEVRIQEAEAVNPLYMQKVHKQIAENCTTSTHHIRRTYDTAYEAVMKGELDTHLIKSELVQIGKFGVDACMNAGLIEQFRSTGKGGIFVYYALTPEVYEYLTGYTEENVGLVTDRMAGAMICPPDEWTNISDGGYLSTRRKVARPLFQIRGMRPSERLRINAAFTSENMPDVFECGNYLQSQPFSLHPATLAAIKRVWHAGGGVMGIPRKNAPQKPECPMPEGWVKADATEAEMNQFYDWKRRAVLYYEGLREWRSKVNEIGGFLRIVDMYDGTLYFPVYFDSRNRWYYRGTPNPQGSDIAKSVIHFADKKPLGARGVFWLKVHIANSLGHDKDRFTDRARWTEQNWPALERALDHPEDAPEVWGTDAPWCAFSAAWELREALRSGDPASYKSGQICHMDATCSGLQHFSAMLRDPVGGLYVNLFDEVQCGPKQDIYSKVATNALAAIARDAEGDDPDTAAMAAWWLSVGIPRALAKKPVNS